MSEDYDFQNVIDELEESDHVTDAIYRLENLKHVYGGEEYNKVMAEIYDENYEQAREILDELEDGQD